MFPFFFFCCKGFFLDTFQPFCCFSCTPSACLNLTPLSRSTFEEGESCFSFCPSFKCIIPYVTSTLVAIKSYGFYHLSSLVVDTFNFILKESSTFFSSSFAIFFSSFLWNTFYDNNVFFSLFFWLAFSVSTLFLIYFLLLHLAKRCYSKAVGWMKLDNLISRTNFSCLLVDLRDTSRISMKLVGKISWTNMESCGDWQLDFVCFRLFFITWFDLKEPRKTVCPFMLFNRRFLEQ